MFSQLASARNRTSRPNCNDAAPVPACADAGAGAVSPRCLGVGIWPPNTSTPSRGALHERRRPRVATISQPVRTCSRSVCFRGASHESRGRAPHRLHGVELTIVCAWRLNCMLAADTKWAAYFKLLYGELPASYPVCVFDFYVINKTLYDMARASSRRFPTLIVPAIPYLVCPAVDHTVPYHAPMQAPVCAYEYWLMHATCSYLAWPSICHTRPPCGTAENVWLCREFWPKLTEWGCAWRSNYHATGRASKHAAGEERHDSTPGRRLVCVRDQRLRDLPRAVAACSQRYVGRGHALGLPHRACGSVGLEHVRTHFLAHAVSFNP